MHAEFKRLTMSDLRGQLGEVIDAVAAGTGAYIVERKGLPLACIVPVSELLPAIQMRRIHEELDALTAAGLEPTTQIDEKRRLVFRVAHSLKDGTAVMLRILMPHGYPDVAPAIFVSGLPQPSPPHMWKDGALCTEGSFAWNPGRHDVTDAVRWGRAWLEHYDVWRTTGTWPDGGGR